ncbi:hypothetical protein Gotur_029081 [Gossypium turneri]
MNIRDETAPFFEPLRFGSNDVVPRRILPSSAEQCLPFNSDFNRAGLDEVNGDEIFRFGAKGARPKAVDALTLHVEAAAQRAVARASVHIRLLDRELIMENEFLDKVEDNAAVQTWSEELKEIWDQWNDDVKQPFYSSYGDLPYLLDIKVDKHLFRALAQFWNSAYSCFTFGGGDLVPTVEEYMALLRCLKIQADRVYSRAVNVPNFLKKLINITGMNEQWVAARIKQKGDSKCISWKNLRDLILAHPDTKKKVDVFALSVYGLVVFSKALEHVDEAVTNPFDRLDKGVTLVPVILAETFRSLNGYRRTSEGRFTGCPQLLLAWFHSHFWKVEKVSYRVFSKNYSPLREIVVIPRRDDISEEKWMEILRNLREEDIEWRALWMLPDEILYRCGNFDWVPLLGIWGAVGYAPLLVLRQFRSRQFVLATQGLAQCEFSYKDYGYKKKIREMSNAWNQTRRMKRLAVGPIATPEYIEWWGRRINDNISGPSQGDELEKTIEQMEKEKMNLRLDMDVQKLETEKLRKRKDKEEKIKTDRWERKFQEAQIRNETLEKSLSESRNEKGELKARVAELEKILYQYRNRNSIIELRASLDKIEQMKRKVEELEMALQNCEMRIESLEASEERQKE